MVDGVWREAIEQEKIEALGQPDLADGFEKLLDAFDPSKELTVTLETDVAPVPKLKATKGLNAEAESVSYDPAKVEEMIEEDLSHVDHRLDAFTGAELGGAWAVGHARDEVLDRAGEGGDPTNVGGLPHARGVVASAHERATDLGDHINIWESATSCNAAEDARRHTISANHEFKAPVTVPYFPLLHSQHPFSIPFASL